MKIVLALFLVLLITASAMGQNRREPGNPPHRDTITNQRRDNNTPPPQRNIDNGVDRNNRDRNNRGNDIRRVSPPRENNQKGDTNPIIRGDNSRPSRDNRNDEVRRVPPPRENNQKGDTNSRGNNGLDRRNNDNSLRDNNLRPGDQRIGNMTFYNPNLSPKERLERYQRDNRQAIDNFRNSQEGRRYDWGVQARRGIITRSELRPFFRRDYHFYPYYHHEYMPGLVYISPFHYYHMCPPYLLREHVFVYTSIVLYIDVPIYRENIFVGYQNYDSRSNDDYYLLTTSSFPRDLRNVARGIEDAYLNSDIDLLAQYIDANNKIAICNNGKYDYSISPNDYLDLTRDAFINVETKSFSVYGNRKVSADMYVLYAKHTYDQNKIVYLNFVVQKVNDRYSIIQISINPEKNS